MRFALEPSVYALCIIALACAGCEDAAVGSPRTAIEVSDNGAAVAALAEDDESGSTALAASEPSSDAVDVVSEGSGENSADDAEGETADSSAAADRSSRRPLMRPPPEQPSEPRQPRVVRPNRPAARRGGALEITFDAIKFDIEKGEPFEREMLTPEIEELFGQDVRIRGYILPTSVFQQSDIKQFVLVRDNQECCFGPGAAIYDCIIVEMQGSATADFSVRPVAVEGTLALNEVLDFEGGHLAIYHLDGTAVK
mgnify:CR=1 FL=1